MHKIIKREKTTHSMREVCGAPTEAPEEAAEAAEAAEDVYG